MTITKFAFIVSSFLLVIFVVPVFLLRKLTRLQRRKSRSLINRSRFTMVDLLALMFLVQLPISLARIFDARVGELHPINFVFMFTVALLIWGAALLATNHLGVTHKLKRVVAMAFTFPGAVSSGFLLWNVSFQLIEKWQEWSVDSESEDMSRSFLVFVVLAIAVPIGVECSTRWIVADVKLEDPVAASESGN